MDVLVASGGHKNYLSARAASASIARGLVAHGPGGRVTELPVADGGEGTLDAIVSARGGVVVDVPTRDALFRSRRGRVGVYEDSGVRTGVIEIADAAGSALLAPHERQTMIATSYGVGELVIEAVALGCRRIVVGLGGSIVSDMGLGMAQALGIDLLDAAGDALAPIANRGFNALSLRQVKGFRFDAVRVPLDELDVIVACDVSIPLLGPEGQARTFGPQKGADAVEIAYLDAAFGELADVAARELAVAIDRPMAGAAGGLGAGLLAFCRATLVPGADFVATEIGLPAAVSSHDAVVIGEGRLDATTLLNKAPFFAGMLAKRCRKHVIAVVGTCAGDVTRTFFDDLISLDGDPSGPELSPASLEARLETAGRRVGDLLAEAPCA